MPVQYCRSCNTPLVNRRAHATTCSSACRAKVWRLSKITTIPVKLMLSFTNYALITKAANAAGVSINQFAHDRLVQTMEASQC